MIPTWLEIVLMIAMGLIFSTVLTMLVVHRDKKVEEANKRNAQRKTFKIRIFSGTKRRIESRDISVKGTRKKNVNI